MNIFRHIIIVISSLFLLVGIPFFRTDYFANMRGGVDSMTSASLVIEKPSGEFVLFINKGQHPNSEKLGKWLDFFEGREFTFIFEDIHVLVPKGDAGGLSMARSLQSQLPENQMILRQEDGVLLTSKAEEGLYDMILMSKEAADAYHTEDLFQDSDTIALRISGKDSDGKEPDGKGPDGKKPDGKGPDGKKPDGKKPDVREPDVRGPDGQESDRRDLGGRLPEGRLPDGK
ncbi:MAG: hypothetical protein K5989_05370 [Lachnospiraceae bacterium]|nr:hypothetical protein [Lachnospiraceae bacterium]